MVLILMKKREFLNEFIVLLIFLGLIGVLMILWDKKKQGWHDKVSGTMVLPNKFGVTASSKLSEVTN